MKKEQKETYKKDTILKTIANERPTFSLPMK